VTYQQVILEALAQYPQLVPILGAALAAVRVWQSRLTWTEFRTFHGIKLLGAQWRGWFVHEKGGRDDAEFLTTYNGTVRAAARTLVDAGGSYHLINAVKRRPGEYGDQYSLAHVVWSHADGTQTEAYLFRNDDGTTDVYAHRETSVSDPVGHLTDPQRDGDPRGIVKDALGIET